METGRTVITVQAAIQAPVKVVWHCWTAPEHITRWNSASPDWHTPRAANDLRPGGRFECRMEAVDGSMGFDFGGSYDAVTENEYIEYTMDDGRKAWIRFIPEGSSTRIEEKFEAEDENPAEMQQAGWQSILNNFKRYAEGLNA